MVITETNLSLHAYKPGGRSHQSWQAALLAQSGDWIITSAAYGTPVQHHTKGLKYIMTHSNLGIFNKKEYYNVFIDFHANGDLKMLYVNIATPAILNNNTVSWTDLELDIVRLPGEAAKLVDKDEFEDAKAAGSLPSDLADKAGEVATSLLPVVARKEFPFLTDTRSVTEKKVMEYLDLVRP